MNYPVAESKTKSEVLKYIRVGVLVLCWVSIQAQNPIPTLKSIIDTTQNDSLRAATYYDLAFFTRYQDIRTAKMYSDSGLYYYRKMGDSAGIYLKPYLDGALAHAEGLYENAIEFNQLHYDWAKRTNNPERLSYAISAMGKYYREVGDLTKAVDYTLQGIALQDSMGMSDENGFYYAELGDLFTTMKQWDLAQKYIQKSLDLAIKTNFTVGQSFSLRNLGSNALETGNYNQAIGYIKEAIVLDSTTQYKPGMPSGYRYLGLVYEKIYEPELAEQAYKRAIFHTQELENNFESATIYQALARIALAQNKIQAAQTYLKEADRQGERLEQINFITEQEKLQALLLEKQGKFEEAYFVAKSYHDKKDALLDDEIANQITGQSIQYETEKKEQEIKLLNAQNEVTALKLRASNLRNLGLGLGIVVFGILLFFLFGLLKRIRKQNAIISKALKEKDLLLKEIHHRVKNNLQVISSLLTLQGRYSQDPLIEAAIKESKDRVKTMSLIHQTLYKKENLSGIELKAYFENLFSSLFESYKTNEDQVSMELAIDPIQLDIDTAVTIGLIVNELVSNSLKYAFPSGQNGIIKVFLTEEDNELVLEVSDNGVGFSREKQLSEGGSFGHELIEAFAAKLEAHVDIESSLGKGTQVSLSIRNYSKVA